MVKTGLEGRSSCQKQLFFSIRYIDDNNMRHLAVQACKSRHNSRLARKKLTTNLRYSAARREDSWAGSTVYVECWNIAHT